MLHGLSSVFLGSHALSKLSPPQGPQDTGIWERWGLAQSRTSPLASPRGELNQNFTGLAPGNPLGSGKL